MREDWEITNTLRRLRGQFCTPPGIDSELVQIVQTRGLAWFCEWPSGHWRITDAGNDFLRDHDA